jgi:hypothetical protein
MARGHGTGSARGKSATQPAFVQLDAPGGARVDLHAAGVGPAAAVVEAEGAFVAVKDPEAGVGEAAEAEPVERGGMQKGANAAAPDVRSR